MSLNSPIHLEPALTKDLPALRELFLVTRKAAFTWTNPDKFSLDDFDLETEGELVWVARLDDRIIGFVSVWLPGHFIHHLFVAPSFQRMGAGATLLEKALALITGQASLKCMVQNIKAVLFYRQQGFEESERGISNEGEFILFTHKKRSIHE